MLQGQKNQISHSTNIEELSEQDLQAIIGAGGGCGSCRLIAYKANAESQHISSQLPRIENKHTYDAKAGEGFNYQTLANDALKHSHGVQENHESCRDCQSYEVTFNNLKWGRSSVAPQNS